MIDGFIVWYGMYAERPTCEANRQLCQEVTWLGVCRSPPTAHVNYPVPPPLRRLLTFLSCGLPSFPTTTLQLHQLISSIYPSPGLIASSLPRVTCYNNNNNNSSTNLSATAVSSPTLSNPIPATPFSSTLLAPPTCLQQQYLPATLPHPIPSPPI